jgi:hypothetical protein
MVLSESTFDGYRNPLRLRFGALSETNLAASVNRNTDRQLVTALDLLGIEALEKM